MQNIIVIGASAGGVEALKCVVSGLQPGLDAAVFAVLHIGNKESMLPEILSRAGSLPALHPRHGEAIQNGRIYVAPPDRHLLVAPGHIHLSQGPKENRSRPAINPLFRSAAMAYDGAVTGVILTGMLDDGVAGLAEISRQGGLTVVQDPQTALFPSMPQQALKHVDVDYVLSLDEIACLVRSLSPTSIGKARSEEPVAHTLTEFICPDCGGPIREEKQGRIVEYRCRVGHAYSPLSFAAQCQEQTERSLWSAVLALEQEATLAESPAADLGAQARNEAQQKRAQAELMRQMLKNNEIET